MSYVLDTCVCSEVRKRRPDPRVVARLAGIDNGKLFITVVICGELKSGIASQRDPRQRQALAAWYPLLLSGLEHEPLGLTQRAAERWGTLRGTASRVGRSLAIADAMIAAIALERGFAVITRNVKDFEPTGVAVVDPWGSDGRPPTA